MSRNESTSLSALKSFTLSWTKYRTPTFRGDTSLRKFARFSGISVVEFEHLKSVNHVEVAHRRVFREVISTQTMQAWPLVEVQIMPIVKQRLLRGSWNPSCELLRGVQARDTCKPLLFAKSNGKSYIPYNLLQSRFVFRDGFEDWFKLSPLFPICYKSQGKKDGRCPILDVVQDRQTEYRCEANMGMLRRWATNGMYTYQACEKARAELRALFLQSPTKY